MFRDMWPQQTNWLLCVICSSVILFILFHNLKCISQCPLEVTLKGLTSADVPLLFAYGPCQVKVCLSAYAASTGADLSVHLQSD